MFKKKAFFSVFFISLLVVLLVVPFVYFSKATDMTLHVDGNQIKDVSNNIVYLRGVNRPWFYDDPSGCWGGWANYHQSDVNIILGRMQGYGFNCLRLHFTAEWWINNPSVSTESGSLTFRQILDDLLTRCETYGIYMVLDTYSVTYAGLEDKPYPNALIADATAFTAYIVEQVDVLGSHHNLIIEPYNEPYCRSDWATQSRLDAWAIAWQNVINGVRAKETAKGYIHHLIMIQYGSTLAYWGNLNDNWMNFNWITSNPLTDSANNLVYDEHCYRRWGSVGTETPDSNKPSDYTTIKARYTLEHVLSYSNSYPLFIGEIGAYASGTGMPDPAGETAWLTNTLQILNEWGLGYTYYTWRDDTATENAGLCMLVVGSEATTGGTVNSIGQILVDAIAEYYTTYTTTTAYSTTTTTTTAITTSTSGTTTISGGSPVFSDGFESGTILTSDTPAGAWSSKTGTPTVVTTAPHSGTYHLSAATSAYYVQRTLASPTEIYYQAYIRFSASPGAYQVIKFMEVDSNPNWYDLAEVCLYADGATVKWQLVYRNAGSQVTVRSVQQTNPSINTYYQVELSVKASASVAEYHVWVNGAELTDLAETGKNTGDTSIAAIRLGITYMDATSTVYADDVSVAYSYIGSPSTSTSGTLTFSTTLYSTIYIYTTETSTESGTTTYTTTSTLSSTTTTVTSTETALGEGLFWSPQLIFRFGLYPGNYLLFDDWASMYSFDIGTSNINFTSLELLRSPALDQIGFWVQDGNLTIKESGDYQLTLLPSGTPYSTATVQVFCFGLGEPSEVSGATSYSYADGILTFHDDLPASSNVVIRWGAADLSRYVYLIMFVLGMGMMIVPIAFIAWKRPEASMIMKLLVVGFFGFILLIASGGG